MPPIGYVTGVVVDNYSSFRTYIADAYYSVIRVVDNGVINTYAGTETACE